MVSAQIFFFVNIIKSDMAKSKQANKKKMVPKKASKKAAPKRNTGKKHQKKGKSTRGRKLRGGRPPVPSNLENISTWDKQALEAQLIRERQAELERMREEERQKEEMEQKAERERKRQREIEQDIIMKEQIAARNAEVERIEAQQNYEEGPIGQLEARISNVLRYLAQTSAQLTQQLSNLRNSTQNPPLPLNSSRSPTLTRKFS